MSEEIKRRPASENPWYVLMTIAGEQGERIDDGLHEKNRDYWNGWVRDQLRLNWSEEKYSDVRGHLGAAPELSESKLNHISDVVRRRCSKSIPKLQYTIDLRATRFGANLDLTGFVFPVPVSCSDSYFSEVVEFREAMFLEQADFRGCEFHGDVRMYRTRFVRKADFSETRFWGNARLQYSNFHDVGLSDCVFKREASFSYSIFSHNTYFNRALFEGSAWFEDVTFKHGVFFSGTEFLGMANYTRAKFRTVPKFDGAQFSKTANFTHGAFEKGASFLGCGFSGDLDFSDAYFKGQTTFQEVTYSHAPPLFYNATLHEDTIWYKVGWPRPPTVPLEAHGHRRAYERLKLIMDTQKKSNDEIWFHRKELECREVEDGFPANVPSRLYGFISKYGWSFLRPVVGLAALILLGWMFISAGICWDGSLEAPEMAGCGVTSIYLSISNTFSFLGFWRSLPEFATKAVSQSNWLLFVKLVQAILGPVFLFFVLLALRNRYRMR